MSEQLNNFEQYITGLRPAIKRHYDRSVNRDLSQQNWQGVFKRNVIAVLQQAYEDSLTQLGKLSYDAADQAPRILTCYDGLIDEVMQYALQKHRSSCALSNFPDEHNPAPYYIAVVLEATAADWQTFVAQVERLCKQGSS